MYNSKSLIGVLQLDGNAQQLLQINIAEGNYCFSLKGSWPLLKHQHRVIKTFRIASNGALLYSGITSW
jgi:hypothetical protein